MSLNTDFETPRLRVAHIMVCCQIDPLTGYPEYDAVLWKGGQVINLGTFGGNVGFGSAINNRGQIAGAALNTNPDPFAFDFTFDFLATPGATESHAALWQMGKIYDLGTLGGPDSVAWFINESGQIAGQSYTDSIVNPTTGQPTLHPYSLGKRENEGPGHSRGCLWFSLCP